MGIPYWFKEQYYLNNTRADCVFKVMTPSSSQAPIKVIGEYKRPSLMRLFQDELVGRQEVVFNRTRNDSMKLAFKQVSRICSVD